MNQLLEEIFSQSNSLKKTFNYILKKCKPQFLELREFIKKGEITKLIFTGMGSSYIAAYLPYYMLNKNGVLTEIRESGDFLYSSFPDRNLESFKRTAVVFISQSGESIEVRELVKRINKISVRPLTIGITNNPDSYLANMTEVQFFMNIEEEKTVSTKTYTSTLLILYVMAKTIIEEYFLPDNNNVNETLKFLEKINAFLSDKEKIETLTVNIAKFLGKDVNFLEILADGASMATAHEASLIFKEITKSWSEANSCLNFWHGGIECLNDKTNLILLTSDETHVEFHEKFLENLLNKWKFRKLIHVTNQELKIKIKKASDNKKIFTYSYDIKDKYLATIYEIIILQLVFHKIAEIRGLNPGEFIYSEKVRRNF